MLPSLDVLPVPVEGRTGIVFFWQTGISLPRESDGISHPRKSEEMTRWMKRIMLLSVLLAPMTTACAWDSSDAEEALPATSAHTAGDYAKAALLYAQLAERGNAVAQFKLGLMYAHGQHVQKNMKESVQWYLLAAEQGYADAQFELGMIYRQVTPPGQDYAKAMEYLSAAATQGHTQAMRQMASMYIQGMGVMQDDTEAVHWYRMAAELGDTTAQRSLSTAYAMGKGVEQNPVMSFMWLILAVSHAHSAEKQRELSEQVELAARDMAATQIEEARALATQCAARHLRHCE